MTQSQTVPSVDRSVTACVACGCEEFERLFTLLTLGKYEATYCRCRRCQTLQVAHVDWLAEAYAAGAPQLDSGAAQRCILCSLYIRAMRQAGLVRRGGKVLDFGSGSGLLVRLLRDAGFDAVGYDKYVASAFGPEFSLSDLTPTTHFGADLITAFEVFEHIVCPKETLELLNANLSPDGVILFRTLLYQPESHGQDWEYLHPSLGQHINFFTAQGLVELGRPLNLTPVFLPFGFHLFVRAPRTVGVMRRTAIFALAAGQFAMARAIGLCDFRQARKDYHLIRK
jgi:hypothetical protein